MHQRKADRTDNGPHGRRRAATAMYLWMPWLAVTGHRRIGTLYFVFAVLAGIIGAGLSLPFRMQMAGPSGVYVSGGDTALFNSAHGIVMVFFMMVPALFCGFGNWLVPLMAGTGEMAFPRLNRTSFFMLVAAFLLFATALLLREGSIPMAAWLVTALHVMALSTVFSAVNFIVTIITMRAPGMTFSRMPPFVWSILIASFLMLFCLPVMTGAVTLWLGGLARGAVPQDAPRLYLMFWFFSHPEIHVLLLPAFGIVSHVVATFSGRPLYAEKAVIAAMATIGLAGFVLWTHSLSDRTAAAGMQTYFDAALPVIGLPAAFIVLCWLATLWRRQILWRVPMLWAAGFMVMFLAGIISGIHLAMTGASAAGAMAFVPHFHYVTALVAVFAIFAGWYLWFPVITGYAVCERTGKLHFWMMFTAVNLVFLLQHFHGLATESSPAGIAAMVMAVRARLAAAGALVATCSVGVFLYGVIMAFVRRRPAVDPWGKGTVALEWPFSPSAHRLRQPVLPGTGEGVCHNEK